MKSKRRNGMSHSDAGRLGSIKARPIIEKHSKENRKNYYNAPKLCKQCKTPLSYEKKRNSFCGHSCSATYTNVVKMGRKERIISKCLQCKKEIRGAKYCSRKCQSIYEWNERKLRFINTGGIIATNDTSIRCFGKRFLIEENGHQCDKCKLSKWMGKKIPLNIHHIDGDANNNMFDNIQLLCLNCHGQTDNYGSKNKNGTRKDRK